MRRVRWYFERIRVAEPERIVMIRITATAPRTLPGDLRFSSLGSVALRPAILVLAIWPISSVAGLLIGE